MSVYEKMTEDEKKWMMEAGYDPICANSHPEKDTINILWAEYAARGYILAEAQAMSKRLED